ncbi:unnamed protein product [Symbiodinium microadriaticum]|nr:unnamed protein product [Symbiodinium microadriaticum]
MPLYERTMAGFQLVGMTVMFLVALRLVAGVVPAPDGAPAGVSDGALEDAPAAMVDASEAAGVTAVDELFEDRDEEPAVPEAMVAPEVASGADAQVVQEEDDGTVPLSGDSSDDSTEKADKILARSVADAEEESRQKAEKDAETAAKVQLCQERLERLVRIDEERYAMALGFSEDRFRELRKVFLDHKNEACVASSERDNVAAE